MQATKRDNNKHDFRTNVNNKRHKIYTISVPTMKYTHRKTSNIAHCCTLGNFCCTRS